MKILISTISILLLASGAWTAPSISNVTGTISNGQTLTISGTSLLNENTVNWVRNDDYSGSISSQTYFTNLATGDLNYAYAPNSASLGWAASVAASNTATIDTVNYLMGDRSVRLYENTPCGDATSCGITVLYATTSSLPNVYYVSTYFKYTGSIADYYQKFYLTVGGSGQFYIQPHCNGDGTATGWTVGNGTYNCGGLVFGTCSCGSFTWPANEWHHFEAQIDRINYSGDRITIWIDGVQDYQYTFASHNSASPTYNEIGIPNWSSGDNGNPTAVPVTMWINRYVHSSARINPSCMIEVGNSPTYSAGSVVKQLPVYLSDSSVQFKLNTTGLGSGPYYLWVTDNRQARNGTPYQLGSSTGSAPVADFTASAISGNAPLTVTFTDTSLNSPTSWGWDFGQNTYPDSTLQNPSKTFSTPGTYTISLTATNAYGSDVETKTSYITVTNPQQANAGTLLFYEGFELGDSYVGTNWGTIADGSGYPTDTTEHHSGSRSMRLTWDIGDYAPNIIGGGNANSGTLRRNVTPSDEMYVSFWAKVSSAWVGAANAGYHPHLFVFLSDSDISEQGNWPNLAFCRTNFYVEVGGATGRIPRIRLTDAANIDQDNLFTSLCATTENRGVNGCNGDCDSQGIGECYDYGAGTYYNGRNWDSPSILITDTNWHHIEAYIKMNTISGSVGQADGVMRLWADGVEVVNENEVIIRTNQNPTMTLQQFVIAPWIGDGSTANQSLYIDDLEVWDGMPSETPSSSATLSGGTGVGVSW